MVARTSASRAEGPRLISASTILNDRERRVMRLVVIEDHTHAEAANVMGLSRQMVTKHLCSALDRLAADRNLVLDYENF